MIRLCLEKDTLSFFKDLKFFREILISNIGEGTFGNLDIRGVTYQAKAIDTLLLNDLKTNLIETFSLKNFDGDLAKYYADYRFAFPYRLKNKFEEYTRFLGFLLYKVPGEDKNLELTQLIRTDYSVFLCTLKRERLLKELVYLKNIKRKESLFYINPTAVADIFTKFTKSGKKKVYRVFFYGLNDSQISISDIDAKLYKFIENHKTALILESVMRDNLKIDANKDLKNELVVQSELFIMV